MGVYKINFSIIISDKDGKELIREKIITEIPNEWNYTQHLGELRWLDDKNVALISKEKDRRWFVKFDQYYVSNGRNVR